MTDSARRQSLGDALPPGLHTPELTRPSRPCADNVSWPALRRRLRRSVLMGAIEHPATLLPALAALFGVVLYGLFPSLGGLALVLAAAGTLLATTSFLWRWRWRFEADFGVRLHRALVASDTALRAGRARALTTRCMALRGALADRGARSNLAHLDRIGACYARALDLMDLWSTRSRRRLPDLAPVVDQLFELALQALEYRQHTTDLTESDRAQSTGVPDAAELPSSGSDETRRDANRVPTDRLDPVDQALAATLAERRSVLAGMVARRTTMRLVAELVETGLYAASADIARALSTPAMASPGDLETALHGAATRVTALLGVHSPGDSLHTALAAVADGILPGNGGEER